MTWNPQRITILQSLWAEGRSASEIAASLGGVTRNAVIGKIYRLRLPPKLRVRRRRRRSAFPSPRRAPSLCTQARIPDLAPPPPVHPLLRDLNALHCRWPEGDPKTDTFHFCGRPPLAGKPYCPHHQARAFTPPPRRKRRTAAQPQTPDLPSSSNPIQGDHHATACLR
ncbi:GcrA family cell cycle regulator [Hyphomicrobium sp. MC8b]|uniref:GcrA family cell cycle regulator n=1 Tax=Hyphomicrobium sp. MC8b TaxID=300273 RepID=UPI00391A0B86